MSFNSLSKFFKKKQKPNITQQIFKTKQGVINPRTLLITVTNNFNQEKLNAGTLLTVGMARGWADACGDVKLIHDKDLIKELPNHNNPIIYTNIYNYINWSKSEINTLKNYDKYAIVNVHPKKYEKFKKENPLIGYGDPFFYGGYDQTCKKLIKSEPKLVCSFSGNAAQKWYNDWGEDGLHFEFIKLAADPYLYYPDQNEKYKKIQIAYVGGYWPEKAQAFDLYLKPWENILHTYGYSIWPYKNYNGKLNINEERQLYSSAGLIPLVTSPAGWAMAEVTERYFKAPACRAFCIADQNPGIKDIYNKDEILQAENPEHFSFLINEYLKGKIDIEYWKKRSHQAVIERHLYKHRAIKIRSLIENK